MIGDTDMNLSNSLEGEPKGEGLQGGSLLRWTSCQANTGYHTLETEPLVLLMRATLPGGGPLASHTFTARDVAKNLLEYTGQNATDIEVVTDREAILEFEPDIRAGAVAQALHGSKVWKNQVADLSCLLSMQCSIMNII